MTDNDSRQNNDVVERDENSSSKVPRGNLQDKVLYYSAPLPPAAELQRYDVIVPGAGDRIIKMAEKQSDHRQRMENKALNITFFGQILTVGLGVFLIYLGYRLCISNNPWTGSFLGLLGASPLVVAAGSFITGKFSSKAGK